MKAILILSLSCISFGLYSQSTLEGIITDQQGEVLPFVNVLINDSPKDGVTSDIDGRFQIEEGSMVESLTFSYVGFEDKRLVAPFDKPLRVQLEAIAYDIETIEIIAGENPAHRIIREVVKNKEKNDHEQMNAYQCLTYNKMRAGVEPLPAVRDSFYAKKDTTKKRLKKQYDFFKNTHKAFAETDILLIESVSSRKFEAPNKLQEEVLHNRVAGFKELPLVALATEAQPFTFYEDNILLFEEAFLNPISKGSTKKYFFQIQDTLYQQMDSIFIISFQPKKGKNFEGLKGLLYINTNQYAIQNVIAEPFDKSLLRFKIEQQYEWVQETHWFPRQLNYELTWDTIDMQYSSLNFTNIFIYGKTYISEVDFTPSFPKKTFKKGEHLIFKEDAFEASDSTWSTYRLDSLSTKELRTYELLDSIGTKLKFDKWLLRLAALGEGKIPLGPVDWVIRNSIAFNRHEKFRLGLGLSTNETLSDKFEIGGYYAYGFGDKTWKYGANVNFFFDKYEHNRLELHYKKDIGVPALLNEALSDNLLTAQLFSQNIDNFIYKGATFYSRPIRYLSTSITFGQHQFQPTYDYTFSADALTNNQIYTEFGVNLRYAYNEKFSRFLGYSVFENTDYPILELNYTKGLSIWEGQYDYSKITFSIQHRFRSRFFGETSYRIEAGYLDRALPLNRLFAAPAFGNGLSVQILSNSFRTMDPFEFISDRFVNFYFRQDFGSLLFKAKRLHPKIAIEHNLAFGSLQNRALHQDIDFKTLDKGFFEAGLVVNDLIRLNYLDMFYFGLGVGAFYRYGPNALDSFKENRRLQLTTTMSF